MDKYEKIVFDELAKYNLTRDDLNRREYEEMLQEAKDRENPEIHILDGYFGSNMALSSIELAKAMGKPNKYERMVIDELAQYELDVEDLTSEEYQEMLEEAHVIEEEGEFTILDGYFGGTILALKQFDKESKQNKQ